VKHLDATGFRFGFVVNRFRGEDVKGGDSVYVQRARLSLGLRLAAGERAKAEALLRKIPPGAGGLHKMAGERIEELVKAKRGKI
jgi:hypothetical protein